eukprot:EG_transcript_50613
MSSQLMPVETTADMPSQPAPQVGWFAQASSLDAGASWADILDLEDQEAQARQGSASSHGEEELITETDVWPVASPTTPHEPNAVSKPHWKTWLEWQFNDLPRYVSYVEADGWLQYMIIELLNDA